MNLPNRLKAGRLLIMAALLFVTSAAPLFAWYFFIAPNGQRQQWAMRTIGDTFLKTREGRLFFLGSS